MSRWCLRPILTILALTAFGIFAAQASSAEEKPPAPAELKVTATLTKPLFQPDARYDDTLVVIVEDQDGKRVPDAEVTAEVGAGPVALYTAAKPEESTTAHTKATGGVAMFGIAAKKMDEGGVDDFFIIVQASKDKSTGKTVAQGDLGSGFEQSFRSERVSSEVFMGASMARSYDQDGKSTGFDETSVVGRFRVDTLWFLKEPQALHTGLELQFGTFPTVKEDATSTTTDGQKAGNPDTFSEFADAYTGSIYVIYQPGAWSSYSPTSQNRDPALRYDAFRHGIIARVGVTSREAKSKRNGDTDILHYRVGYLFTHHQTRASAPEADTVDVFPMRFVELSVGHYEEIFDKEDATRFILEAGLRLPGLGNDTVPFYAGIFLNAGDGQDDFRVFAGLLFRLDKIVKAFR